MVEWIENLVASMGYLGVAFLMFLENVFPPIPSELIMPLAGFTAARGHLGFWGVILAGTVGSVLGQLPLYYVGRVVGARRLLRLARRRGAWVGVGARDLFKAIRWFQKWGGGAVFFCRLVPGVRSLVSIPAGVCRMNLAKFLLYSTAGMAIWTTVLAWAGWLLGENYDRVEQYVGPVTYVVFGLLAIAYVGWVVRKKIAHDGKKRRRRAAA